MSLKTAIFDNFRKTQITLDNLIYVTMKLFDEITKTF